MLNVEGEGGVFNLHGGDGVDGVGTFDGTGGAFGETDGFDLAGTRVDIRDCGKGEFGMMVRDSLFDLNEGVHGVFNWDFFVNSMDVIEVNVWDSEILQRLVDGLLCVFWVGSGSVCSVLTLGLCKHTIINKFTKQQQNRGVELT